MEFFDYDANELSIIEDNLKKLIFEDIIIDDVKVKILGIHFNNFQGELHIKKHRHSFFEYSYATLNEMNIISNNKAYKAKAGQFYMLPQNVYHAHHIEKDINYRAISIRWSYTRITNSVTQKKWYRLFSNFENATSRPITDNGEVSHSFENLFSLALNNATELEMKLAFCQLLLSILHFYTDNTESIKNENDENNFIDNNVVDMALDFIDNNYHSINVHDVADSVYLSYSHLSRLFKRYNNTTINECINQTRLKHAQILFMTTDKKIAEIAECVGFENVNYFSRLFKKKYNILPKDMRKYKSSISD